MTFFMAKRPNVIFQQMKLGTSAIPHFHVFLTRKFISKIILNIQGHRQGHFQGYILTSVKPLFLCFGLGNLFLVLFVVV